MEKKKVLIIEQKEHDPMQSGLVSHSWIGKICDVDCNGENDQDYLYFIMNWRGSKNTLKQIRLEFKNKEDAENYTKKYNMKLIIKEPKVFIAPIKKKSYWNNLK